MSEISQAEAKKALRQKILAQRDAMDASARAQAGEAIFAQILALPEYRDARVVFSYAGFGSELDTFPFMRQVLADGKTLVMSRINKAARVLDLYQVKDLETDLVPGVWGIREPGQQRCAPFEARYIDFVLMPGSVFDLRCGRMGYGAGFYDKLLAPLSPMPFLVAPAYDLQLVDAVPMEPHDQPLDWVVTEKRMVSIVR